jgi:glutamate racemase
VSGDEKESDRMMTAPRILVFDSGLGGLTVYREIAALRPQADYVYLADDAVFPYGSMAAEDLVARVTGLLDHWIGRVQPDCVVIACNTASTLVLPHLRARHAHLPFVGTVPAIKPAAQHSVSKLISVLATPATVARDYTHELIRQHAAHCQVQLVGAPLLASLAERAMHGQIIRVEEIDEEILAQIAPCFVEHAGQRTDHVVLACTHYPLLMDHLQRLAPWPVHWVDPAPAIARRVDHVLAQAGFVASVTSAAQLIARGRAIFTSEKQAEPVLIAALEERGLKIQS